MPAKLTTEQFIEKARSVHGNKYDYSKVVCTDLLDKVYIICKEHGEFKQTAIDHSLGSWCPLCPNPIEVATAQYITKARSIHGDKYDYSDVVYRGDSNKILIRPKGNNPAYSGSSFWRYPQDHLCGDGYRVKQRGKDSTEQFIEKAKRVHGDKFDYSKVEYKGSYDKVCIICPEHGEFWQVASTHINSGGINMCGGCNPMWKYKNMGIKGAPSVHSYKLKNDMSYRIKILFRTRFRCWLKQTNTPKTGSLTARLQSYVMMNRDSFVQYYESLFQHGMTWKNTHIDHHVPLKHFDPTSEDDMKIAWNWYNLRPLFGEDNISKNATLPDDYEQTIETIKEIIETGCTDPSQLVFDLNKGRDTVRRVSV